MAAVSQVDLTGTARWKWTASVALVRTGGVAAVLAGVVMGVHEWWDDRVPGVQEGVVPSSLHATWVGLMFVGFLGLSALQRPAFGRFGRVASRLAVAGTGCLFVLALNETWNFARSHGAPQADPPLPVMVVLFVVIGCYVAGLMLFSIATIRAGVLPRAAGIFLLVSVLLKIFASGVLPGTLALMGVAFAAMGLTALRAVGSTGPSRQGEPGTVEPRAKA
ncbi:hypothetical protein [Pedococcus sp. 5OH_020]|uniref:hypothetical protein n=1 Tax=Pedococcus sp. 5OH_020 TaxID=2989814 RepID=UPI0022E9D070|nr:hypothetical protein [Pedococcus sp. 5OH_020]